MKYSNLICGAQTWIKIYAWRASKTLVWRASGLSSQKLFIPSPHSPPTSSNSPIFLHFFRLNLPENGKAKTRQWMMHYFLFSCCPWWEDLFSSPRVLGKKITWKKREGKYPRSQRKSTLWKCFTWSNQKKYSKNSFGNQLDTVQEAVASMRPKRKELGKKKKNPEYKTIGWVLKIINWVQKKLRGKRKTFQETTITITELKLILKTVKSGIHTTENQVSSRDGKSMCTEFSMNAR